MRTWMKLVGLLAVLCTWNALGCGGTPNEPLLRFAGVKECNPNEVFKPYGGIPLSPPPKVDSSVFVKGERAGCLGVYWDGQTGDPPTFAVLVKEDGSYLVYDPDTKQPATQDNKIGATVSPGVPKVNVAICITNTPSANILDLNCNALMKGGIANCMANSSRLFGWQGLDIPLNPSEGNGTCKLCYSERCDNLDNDCDGQVDEDGACGSILGVSCKAYDKPAIDAGAPKCSAQEECGCLRLSNGSYYVCAGPDAQSVAWVPVATGGSACTQQVAVGPPANNIYYCGREALVCDQCDTNYVWRRQKDRCSAGTMTQP